MNETSFKKVIALMESTYNNQYSDTLIPFMWNDLKRFDNQNVINACGRILQEFVPTQRAPLPLLPHFLKHLEMSPEDKAILAISEVKEASSRIGQYRSVSFGDEALHRTIEHFGGWVKVAIWTNDQWKYNESKFSNTYKTHMKCNFGKTGHLPGIHEITNKLGGYDDKKYNRLRTVKLPWSEFKSIEYKEQKLIRSLKKGGDTEKISKKDISNCAKVKGCGENTLDLT